MATIEERVYEGNRAKEVLENEAFQAAFADLEKDILEKWKSSPVRDEAGREKLWLALSLLTKVRESLTRSLETGRLAMLEVEHRQSWAHRVGSVFLQK